MTVKKGMRQVLYGVRDYMMSTGRESQQDAVKLLKIKMLNYHEELEQRMKKAQKSGNQAESEKVTEPSDVFLGKAGAWQMT